MGEKLSGESSSCEVTGSSGTVSWRGLHGLFLVAHSGRSEVSDINIIVLLQFLQTGQDLLLDKVLTLRRRGDGLSGLLHFDQCLVSGQAAQRINKDSVGLGNVEPDVGDLVRHQPVQDWKNGTFNDIECDDGGKGLG